MVRKVSVNLRLASAICEQNGNAIDNRITLASALAAYPCPLKLQRLTTDRANNPLQVLRCHELCFHGSHLSGWTGQSICQRARYHGGDDDNSTNFRWHRNC